MIKLLKNPAIGLFICAFLFSCSSINQKLSDFRKNRKTRSTFREIKSFEKLARSHEEYAKKIADFMEFQRRNFKFIDRWYLQRNFIVLKKNNEGYFKKKVTFFEFHSDKSWINITEEEYLNPSSLMKDFKYGAGEHILYLKENLKDINYKQARKILDAINLRVNP